MFARRPPLLRTLSADEALRQVLSSIVYAFAFGASDKAITKLAPMVSDVASEQSVMHAVYYVILVVFFCPTFRRITRNANLNPTSLVVALYYGELAPLAFIEKFVLIVLGATLGTHLTNHFKCADRATVDAHPLEGSRHSVPNASPPISPRARSQMVTRASFLPSRSS